LAWANRLRGVVAAESGAASALAQNNSASAAAMGVIGNMKTYSGFELGEHHRGNPMRIAPTNHMGKLE